MWVKTKDTPANSKSTLFTLLLLPNGLGWFSLSLNFNAGSGYTTYSVAVRTSNLHAAETRAQVFIQLVDINGKMTDKVKLKVSFTHREKYRRGHTDTFLLLEQPVLAKLKSINIIHRKKPDVSEDERSWHLHSVMVINHDFNELYRFDAMAWLGQNDEPEYTISMDAVGEPVKVFPMNYFL